VQRHRLAPESLPLLGAHDTDFEGLVGLQAAVMLGK
jgi:hypothetical protein